jgi:hypothetical protein
MQTTHSESPVFWLLVDSAGAVVLTLVEGLLPKFRSVLKGFERKSVEGTEVLDELLEERADEVVGNSKRVKLDGEHERRVSS